MLLILTKSSFSYWISHPLFVDYPIIVVGFFLTMILELSYFCGILFVGEVDAHFAAVGELCRWEVKWTEHEMPAGASAPPDSPLRRIAIVFQFRYPPIGREAFLFRPALRFCLHGRLCSSGARTQRKLQTKSRFVHHARHYVASVELRLRTRFDSVEW